MRRYALPAAAYALVVAGAMSVASCGQSSYSELVKGAVASRGADAADETLENLEWGLCSAISVGAIKRRYVGTRKWSAYGVICEWPDDLIAAGMRPRSLVPGGGNGS